MASTTVKIEGLLGMLTIKLGDHNYTKWVFQFKLVLKGYNLFDHFDRSNVCPLKFVLNSETGVTNEVTTAFQEWEAINFALLSLLIATLSDDAIEYVIGCKTASEAWNNLEERFVSVSKTGVNHLKTELHTIQKGSDAMDKYLLRLKSLRDQLTAAGEFISDNDVIIAALVGLLREHETIRTVILARDTSVYMKKFRTLLLGAERENEAMINSLSQNMSALYMQRSASSSLDSQNQTSAGQVLILLVSWFK